MEKKGCPRNVGFRRTWFKRSQACKADILNKMGFERTKQAKSPILLRLLPWENVYTAAGGRHVEFLGVKHDKLKKSDPPCAENRIDLLVVRILVEINLNTHDFNQYTKI